MTDDSDRMPRVEDEPSPTGEGNVPRHMATSCPWSNGQEEVVLPEHSAAEHARVEHVDAALEPASAASPDGVGTLSEDERLEPGATSAVAPGDAAPSQALDEQLPTIEAAPTPKEDGDDAVDDGNALGPGATGAVKAADVRAPKIEQGWAVDEGTGTLPGGRGFPHLLVAGIIAVLVAILGSSLILTSCFGLFSDPEVPNVVGLDAASAQAELESQGYDVEVSEQVTQSSEDAGRVLATEPTADSALPSGGDVTLKVGKSPEVTQAVPDLVGLSLDDAVTALAQTKFFVKDDVTFAYSDTVAAGKVISQGPEAGAMEVMGTKVDLVVSDGPNPDAGDTSDFADDNEQSSVSIPDLRGMTVAKATVLLRGMGLEVARGEAVLTDDFVNGTVAAVEPPTDSVVAVGSTVTIHEAQPKAGTAN
ncbi:PASTA domain-containing protein [uncultured Olsenella sp.]|uniref:PASTA domain-containing protein n=1 Tax=uncultured Olsenella sp. TaxID=190764 RepID=UPI0026DDBE79|nr:PASTA domain-containing protein [uncultured Olsenella sp.]